MARSVLLTLLGSESSAVRALRNVGSEADRTADHVDRLDESNRRAGDGADRSEQGHGRLASVLGKLAPAAGQAAASIGMVAAGVGTAVPAVAGLSAALVAIAPAAAVAATGIAAVGLAGAALKIGMSGVGDAVKAALNPANPEAYAKALAKLSPNARAFVEQIHQLQPAFAGIKTAVQDTLFAGLDKSFATAARTTLPIFRDGLVGAAQALNGMGKGLLSSVTELGKSGALKSLFDGANAGLKNLTKIPGQLLRGFVQLGAAAAPVFGRMTKGIGDAVSKVSDKLSGAFKSGALSGAIETAVGLLKELAAVGKNVFTVVQNIFGAANATGGGTIGVLQTITAELAKISGTPQFQQGLQALFGVMNTLAQTAAPLLGQALQVVAQVLTTLAPAATVLAQALGQALQPVITALGPVLVTAAQAVAQLVIAFAPLLPVIGQLIAAVLPILVPVLQLVTQVLVALTPVIAVVAQAITTYLVPVITTVVEWVTKAITWFGNLAAQVFPAVLTAVTNLSGPLGGLKDAFVNLWNAVQPLIDKIATLIKSGFEAIAPALIPVGAALSTAASVLTDGLAWAITYVVIPAVEGFTALLTGDAVDAVKGWADAVGEATNSVVESISGLSGKSQPGLLDWVNQVTLAEGRASKAMLEGINKASVEVVGVLKALPGKAASALSGAPGMLRTAGGAIGKAFVTGLRFTMPEVTAAFNKMKEIGPPIMRSVRATMVSIGKGLVTGLVAGMMSAFGGLMSTISSLGDRIKSAWKAATNTHSPSLMTRDIGEDVSRGLAVGMEDGWPTIAAAIQKIGKGVKDAFGADWVQMPTITIGDKLIKALKGSASQIGDAVKEIAKKIRDAFKAHNIDAGQRDSLLDYLAGSNRQLQKLAEARQKIIDKIKEARDYAKKITQETLSFAALTNIKTEGGGTPSGQELVAGLQAKLAQIRAFSGNIKKLAQAGLSRSLLRQILDAGIDGGSAIAAELANGPNSIIAALNAAQITIEKVAKGLGLNSADLLYDSGKNAGTGFLKGLESMQQAMTDAMNQIVLALLEALGIGIEKYKKKLDELAHLIQQTALMKPPDIPAPPNATPNPLRAPAVPRPILTAAPRPTTPYHAVLAPRAISITQHVTVKDKADADMLMNQAAFSARSLTF